MKDKKDKQEKEVKQEKPVCSVCNGEGRVYIEGDPNDDMRDCPECKK